MKTNVLIEHSEYQLKLYLDMLVKPSEPHSEEIHRKNLTQKMYHPENNECEIIITLCSAPSEIFNIPVKSMSRYP